MDVSKARKINMSVSRRLTIHIQKMVNGPTQQHDISIPRSFMCACAYTALISATQNTEHRNLRISTMNTYE